MWSGLPIAEFKDAGPWEAANNPGLNGPMGSGGQAEGTAAATTLKGRALKMSTLLDQSDE